MSIFKTAWRNLWRSRRRTLITVASVFFAVFFALVMRSLQLGAYDHMFRNVIESYTGYVQIQNEEFWDNKIVDNIFSYTPELEKSLTATENVTAALPRFESFALASSGNLTKGVLVMGIDPGKEDLLSNVKGRLVRYRLGESNINALKRTDLQEKIKRKLDLFKGNAYSSFSALSVDLGINDRDSTFAKTIFDRFASFRNGYISKGEKGSLVAERLAVYLQAGIGDTLILLGQGYHGSTAAGKFRINGIVKIPTPDLDNKLVYLPYDVCQEFYNAPGMLTSLALGIKKNKDSDISALIKTLKDKISPPLTVMGWRDMNKLIINQLDADSKSGMVMIVILYLVIAFGIFGTVLMMTSERRREFGVLVAIGMRKTKLKSVVTVEMIFMGLLGIGSGVAASLPVIFYGNEHPIRFTGDLAKMYEDYGMEAVMPFMLPGAYMLWQSVVVAVIIFIALLYPMRKISNMVVVNSLKA